MSSLPQRPFPSENGWMFSKTAWKYAATVSSLPGGAKDISESSVAISVRTSGDDALRLFYGSQTYLLMREGVSDLHCMSDGYLSDELKH